MKVTRLSSGHTLAREQRSAKTRPASGEARFPAAFRNALVGTRTPATTTPQVGAGGTQATWGSAQAGASAVSAVSTPSIAPLGTPNSEIHRGQLMELGGGVYYNTAEGTYQNLSGSVVGTNRHAVQQYTDPVSYFYSGAAFQPSDTYLREKRPDLWGLVRPEDGSATVILNARWAYDSIHGGPPLGVDGKAAYPRQASPVPLMADPGVLKAPGRPPLEGAAPPWNFQIGAPNYNGAPVLAQFGNQTGGNDEIVAAIGVTGFAATPATPISVTRGVFVQESKA
ncbi:MAG TPA: hypothetical protein VF767_01555 [Bryobacteraceae bacterium]